MENTLVHDTCRGRCSTVVPSGHDARRCKNPKCSESALFTFGGYCSNCAPDHGITVIKVTDAAAEPAPPAAPLSGR